MNHLSRQRDTPTRSPFAKSTLISSPNKSNRQEQGLSLQQVIGTTCNSANCFDVHTESNKFAYTAGAAAVIATVDEQFRVKQQFFRAPAFQYTVARNKGLSATIQSPPPVQAIRTRISHRSREESPFASSAYEQIDSPGGHSGHAKDRVKAATAVSLSKNGKWLAVGETGYRPRVLLFPVTDRPSADSAVTIISEHSFGVQAVAFSPDSKLLATLGTINDGFLYIWEVDDRTGATTLLASNKCTNVVKQIAWMGRALITIGVRFIKVWRPDEQSASGSAAGEQSHVLSSPTHKPLYGRNTLLGTLIDETFSSLSILGATQAVVCSEAGDICVLDDFEKQQRLSRHFEVQFSITSCIVTHQDGILICGTNNEIQALPRPQPSRADTPTSVRNSQNAKSIAGKAEVFPVAIGLLQDVIVTVDNSHHIQVRRPVSVADSDSSLAIVKTFAAHSDPVLGVRALASQAKHDTAFMTWSASGTVMGWESDGTLAFEITIPLDQIQDANEVTNELRTLSPWGDSHHIVSGDKYGVLRVFDLASRKEACNVRAHSSDITDIAVQTSNDMTTVASSGRDRAVQVFAWKDGALELLQTLDEHAGAVTGVLFSGNFLMSMSADRTIVVREGAASGDGPMLYFIARTITLKSSPTCMRQSLDEEVLLVATSDKSIQSSNYKNGKTLNTFKAADSEGGDPVVLSSLVHLSSASGPPIIAAVASTDKSVRLYSDDGTLLARDTGHTEGITDIALLRASSDGDHDASSYRLVTVAADGTIFTWQTSATTSNPRVSDVGITIASPINPSSPIARPPLRKIISHSEISRLRRSESPTREGGPSPPSDIRSPPLAGALRKRPSRLNVNQAPRLEPKSPRYEAADPFASPTSRRSPSPSGTRSLARSPTRSPTRNTAPPGGPMRRGYSSNAVKDRPLAQLEEDYDTSETDGIKMHPLKIGPLSRAKQLHQLLQHSKAEDLNDIDELIRELEMTLEVAKRLKHEPAAHNDTKVPVAVEKTDHATTSGEEGNVEELSAGLASISLHERFEGLRKKSSEVVPGTARAE